MVTVPQIHRSHRAMECRGEEDTVRLGTVVGAEQAVEDACIARVARRLRVVNGTHNLRVASDGLQEEAQTRRAYEDQSRLGRIEPALAGQEGHRNEQRREGFV